MLSCEFGPRIEARREPTIAERLEWAMASRFEESLASPKDRFNRQAARAVIQEALGVSPSLASIGQLGELREALSQSMAEAEAPERRFLGRLQRSVDYRLRARYAGIASGQEVKGAEVFKRTKGVTIKQILQTPDNRQRQESPVRSKITQPVERVESRRREIRLARLAQGVALAALAFLAAEVPAFRNWLTVRFSPAEQPQNNFSQVSLSVPAPEPPISFSPESIPSNISGNPQTEPQAEETLSPEEPQFNVLVGDEITFLGGEVFAKDYRLKAAVPTPDGHFGVREVALGGQYFANSEGAPVLVTHCGGYVNPETGAVEILPGDDLTQKARNPGEKIEIRDARGQELTLTLKGRFTMSAEEFTTDDKKLLAEAEKHGLKVKNGRTAFIVTCFDWDEEKRDYRQRLVCVFSYGEETFEQNPTRYANSKRNKTASLYQDKSLRSRGLAYQGRAFRSF